ncbi:MAG TPA: proline--tRNA ligase [Acidimicrobiales bacterium]|nr:proline--tRNA ligase [Acidimicrobiales bacterium]
MRMSRLLLRTLREAPADAEVVSHQLLVRAGYIRRVASGVYAYLPLGLRLMANISRLVREEFDAAGAQEVLLPAMQPLELWEATGRVALYEDILFQLEGRGGRMVLGPTHEEVVTVTVSADVESWRDLPVTVYQVQTKFRDEARPRFGLLRGREFVMADAYSFDASREAMRVSYQAMYDAYCRVFTRCGLDFTPVEADAGAIGGDVNHEFMVPSAIGEDHFARCPSCGWAANIEAATAGEVPAGDAGEATEELVDHATPDVSSIDDVVAHFSSRGLSASGTLKCIALVDPEGAVTVAVVPGDRDVLVGRVGPNLRPFDEADFTAHPELVRGFIGPMGLQDHGVSVVADPSVRRPGGWVTGANVAGHHVSGAVLGRDFSVDRWAGIASIAAGDPCPRCGHAVELVRSVEAGHTFQLGLRYSSVLPGATFLDEQGQTQPYWMGCYGIGVSRLAAVIAESSHDEAGLVWPEQVAPYRVSLLSLGGGRSPEVAAAADAVYEALTAAGVDVLYDDRDLSPGVKFADADLLGMPVQVVVGAKGLARGVAEVKVRRTGERSEVALDEVASVF